MAFQHQFKNKAEKQEYLNWHFNSHKIYLRTYIFLYILSYPLFGWMDSYGVGDSWSSIFTIRMSVGFPLLVVAFVLSFVKSLQLHYRSINTLALFMMNLSIPLMFAYLAPSENDFGTYYSGLLISHATLGISMAEKRSISLSIILSSLAFILVAIFVHQLHIVDKAYFLKICVYLTCSTSLFSLTAFIIDDRTIRLYLSLKNIESEKGKIEQQNRRLAQIDQSKNRYFSLISHDLKSPFNGLLGFFEVKLLEAKDKVEINSNDFRKMYTQTRNTYELIENMLCWSKKQLYDQTYSPQYQNIKEVILNGSELLYNLAQQKNIKLEIKLDFIDDAKVKCDKEMISAVIRNLVFNAIKFTPANGKITLEAIRNTKGIRISVIDNGIGLSEEHQEKLNKLIFDSSLQGTDGEKGSGIGLQICNDFLKAHQSKLIVDSSINKGSTFSFILPLS